MQKRKDLILGTIWVNPDKTMMTGYVPKYIGKKYLIYGLIDLTDDCKVIGESTLEIDEFVSKKRRIDHMVKIGDPIN